MVLQEGYLLLFRNSRLVLIVDSLNTRGAGAELLGYLMTLAMSFTPMARSLR